MQISSIHIKFGSALIAACFLLACESSTGNVRTGDSAPNSGGSTHVVEPPVTDQVVAPVVREVQVAESSVHEKLYQRKAHVLFVLKRLTQLNEKFIRKEPSASEHIKREKEIFRLIGTLSDDVSDLVTLAKASRTMEIHGRGFNKVVSPFDIAFLRCVKILATVHKDVPGVATQIEELKKFQVDGHFAEEFTLAMEGKDPSFLYSEIEED